MASCVPSCSPTGCGGMPNSEILLKKINTMLSDNYTLLFVLIIILIILGLTLAYFMGNLKTTLRSWLNGRREVANVLATAPPPGASAYTGGDPTNPSDDNEVYGGVDVNASGPMVDPNDFMEPGKKTFVTDIKTTYNEYNTLKTQYIQNNYNGRENDDIVTDNVLYSDHDTYEYSKTT